MLNEFFGAVKCKEMRYSALKGLVRVNSHPQFECERQNLGDTAWRV